MKSPINVAAILVGFALAGGGAWAFTAPPGFAVTDWYEQAQAVDTAADTLEAPGCCAGACQCAGEAGCQCAGEAGCQCAGEAGCQCAGEAGCQCAGEASSAAGGGCAMMGAHGHHGHHGHHGAMASATEAATPGVPAAVPASGAAPARTGCPCGSTAVATDAAGTTVPAPRHCCAHGAAAASATGGCGT